MTQSTVLVAALVALFVLFLAARGRLSSYLGVFFGPKPDKQTASGGGSTVKTVADVAQVAALVLA